MPGWGKLGGSHSMFGGKGVGGQKPGVASQEGGGSLTGSHEPQAGPPGAGFYSEASSNKDYAGTAEARRVGGVQVDRNSKWAEGGKHAMFGNMGSRPCKPGQSGC